MTVHMSENKADGLRECFKRPSVPFEGVRSRILYCMHYTLNTDEGTVVDQRHVWCHFWSGANIADWPHKATLKSPKTVPHNRTSQPSLKARGVIFPACRKNAITRGATKDAVICEMDMRPSVAYVCSTKQPLPYAYAMRHS